MTTWKSMRCTRSSRALARQVRPLPIAPTCIPTPERLRSTGKGKVLIPSISSPAPRSPPTLPLWMLLSAMSLSRRLGLAVGVPLSPKADTRAPSPAKVRLLSLKASEQLPALIEDFLKMSTQQNPQTPAGFSDGFEWTELDRRAVDTARLLAADAVQKVGNGHPGTAMALAPAAYTLFQKVLRHDPADPEWTGRDRFVLSPGHTSLTLYTQLFLSGYELELDDLKAFRTHGSKTPGHPEYGHTAGVETTTGPLGQGVANAVGMAMAARYERGLFDPEAPEGESPFDHTIWAIVSDGDLEEGISAEASSLAGHQKLGNLVFVYDDNHISIEGDTATAFSEDVLGRYEAYGWHVQRIAPSADGDVDVHALHTALNSARAETARPSIIAMRTIIAWPAPAAQNTEASHGSALGADEIAATKRVLGFDPEKTFEVSDEVLAHARRALDRGA